MHITRRQLCKLNMSIFASTNIQESKIRQTQDFQLPDTFPEGVQIVYLTAWSEMHSVMTTIRHATLTTLILPKAIQGQYNSQPDMIDQMSNTTVQRCQRDNLMRLVPNYLPFKLH